MFDEILERMKIASGAKNDNQLSELLRLSSNSVIIGWRNRNKIPEKRIKQISDEFDINEKWLEFGKGEMKKTKPIDIINTQVQKLVSLYKIANSENIILNFSDLDEIIEKMEKWLFTKIIFEKIESIYYKDEPEEDPESSSYNYEADPIQIHDIQFGIRRREKILIDYILKSIQKADIDCFKYLDYYPLAFQDNEDMMPVINSFGYHIDNPSLGKKATAIKIQQLILESFSFNDMRILIFLKNNIDAIKQIWESWIKCEEISQSKIEEEINYVGELDEFEAECYFHNNEIEEKYSYDDPRKKDDFYEFKILTRASL